jgi:hypothetical protein
MMMVIFLASPHHSFAYSVINTFYYDSSNNNYYVNTNTGWEYFSATFYGSAYTGGPYWFKHIAGKQDMTLGCNGQYVFKFYDANGNLIGSDTVTPTDIVNPTCKSDFGGPSIPDPFADMNLTAADTGSTPPSGTGTTSLTATPPGTLTWDFPSGSSELKIMEDGQVYSTSYILDPNYPKTSIHIATNDGHAHTYQVYDATNGVYATNLNFTPDNYSPPSHNLDWNDYTGASSYDVFKNGSFLTNVTSSSFNDPSGTSSDTYEIHALDDKKTIIASDNTNGSNQVTTTSGGNGGFMSDGNFLADHSLSSPSGGNGSNYTSGSSSTSGSTFDSTTCQQCIDLNNTLQCPEWQHYMYDFQQTMTRAMNNANWQAVADTMKNTMVPALDTMLGHPDPPPPAPTPPPVPDMKIDDLKQPDEPKDTTPPVTQDIDFNNVQSVPVEQDTTGGIDLLPADPTESIKHKDPSYIPKPGQESGGDKPMTQQAPAPTPKQGTVSLQPAPKPASGGQLPPGGTPKPTSSTGTTPTPTAPSTSTSPSPAPTLPPP